MNTDNSIYSPKPSSGLISALMNPGIYDHAVNDCHLIETHASWIILTGDFAYKIKKPVNLGFLDFSTLEKRHLLCKEELRLNQRLAPQMYLELITITGTAEKPVLNGTGKPIEFAVKMLQFPQEVQLDRMLARGEIGTSHIDAIARLVADFHKTTMVASKDSTYGDLEHIRKPVENNFIQINKNTKKAEHPLIHELEVWCKSFFDKLKPVFIKRKAEGFIRECHGDMHLRNIAWLNNTPVVFDCIEFDPDLRWIDVISEIAFLVMDFEARKHPQLSRRFLNAYLEESGDYAGVRVLPFYLVYRALVRAKIASIRAGQQDISEEEKAEAEKEFFNYMQLAKSCSKIASPKLIITRGLSASGKSTITLQLLEQMDAIRIRSDVERKRIFGISRKESSKTTYCENIYSPEAIKKTYDKLAGLAEKILDAGYPVIIDAAFLKFEERGKFRKLAEAKKVPFIILEFLTTHDTLRWRITKREKNVSDADLSVLEHQIAKWQPLGEREKDRAITIDTETPVDIMLLEEKVRDFY
ncbi:MAG: AAA family ATPase [Pseudomonadota bacterium]